MQRAVTSLLILSLGLSVEWSLIGGQVAQRCEAAEPPTIEIEASADLARSIEPLIAGHRGEVAVAIKHLGSGVGFVHRGDVPMPTASLIKLAVLVTVYDQLESGRLRADQLLELTEEDKVPGSGILTTQFSAGTQITLRDAIRLMIAYSDNTATNLVVEAIGLPATADQMVRLGFPNTKLHSLVYRRDTSIFPERSQQFGLGSTTALETVALLEAIDGGTLLSRQACDEMLDHLYACEDRSKLVRLLPPKVKVAHKSGYVSKTRVDAGLIDGPQGRIAICVLTDKNADVSSADDNEASLLIGKIAAHAYRHFYPDSATADPPNALLGLARSASGPLVESLQRLLNRNLLPSPELAVDGDFGPATEAALLKYQKSLAVAATGKIDQATLRAMATAVTDLGQRDSAGTDSEPTPITIAEDFTGPPVVSCRAWAIGDASTGALLFEQKANERLDNASTTKLMTAWLVAKLAQDAPEVWDETIEFSRRADDTAGSTAGLIAGEKIRVGDLIYGLLLPSGNDAAVAIAEHFGDRLTPTDSNPADSELGETESDETTESNRQAIASYEAFVAAMNDEATLLGLTQTGFRNPHGLTAEGHHSSAADLFQLANLVLRDPKLAEVTATHSYRADVTKPDGTTRQVTWKNTNRLLSIAGYGGGKTGTTTAAGACLVASGNHQGSHLIVVVLGASGSAARYADARNLFRWAWRQTVTSGE